MTKTLAPILLTGGYILGTCVFIHIIWFGGNGFDKMLLTLFILATVAVRVSELWIPWLEMKK